MNYDIKSHAGVGPIRFGMKSSEIRKVMHEEPEPVDKSSNGIPADYFRQLGIFVFYKQPGICEAVEFFGPASPTFDGQYILGQPYVEMERWIKYIDPDVILNDAGLITKKIGFGLYAPSARKKPELPVKSVIVFEPGYYERSEL